MFLEQQPTMMLALRIPILISIYSSPVAHVMTGGADKVTRVILGQQVVEESVVLLALGRDQAGTGCSLESAGPR